MGLTPIILAQNLFDTVVTNQPSTVSNPDGDDVAGHEYFRVADNLREASWWTTAASNAIRSLRVQNQNPATPTSPNMLVLDRGHNMAGATVAVKGSNDNFSTSTTEVTFTVPATAGGVPTNTHGCVTTDGVFWIEFVPTAPFSYWQVTFPALGAGISPIVTGLYLGTSYRFPEYCLAPAALDYRRRLQYQRNVLSRAALRIKSRPLVFGEIDINIQMENEDYVDSFDAQVQALLYQNIPWWFCIDDTDPIQAGLLRLFQLPGDTTYDPQANPVHREIQLQLEEAFPRTYL